MAKDKIHLLLPDNTFLCKNYGKQSTKEIDDATCKSCKKLVEGSRGWYKAKWENHDRNLAMTKFSMIASQVFDRSRITIAQAMLAFVGHDRDTCAICRKDILVMSFKGTKVCSENCKSKLEEVNEKTLS